MNTKGQHRGHCQACGRIHVIEPSNRLAKHGYRVAGFGYFNGVCFGSNEFPLEQVRRVTDEIIADMRAQAQRNEVRAIALRGGTLKPERAQRLLNGAGHSRMTELNLQGQRIPVIVDWSAASPAERRLQIETDASSAESFAKFARSHAASLTELADRVHGQPLIDRDAEELARKAARKAKSAPIEGAYRTKAAQKSDLERVSRQYSHEREVIVDRYLKAPRMPNDTESDGANVYYSVPHDLHAWRPKTSALVRKVYPELENIVQVIEMLHAQREAIKARPVIK